MTITEQYRNLFACFRAMALDQCVEYTTPEAEKDFELVIDELQIDIGTCAKLDVAELLLGKLTSDEQLILAVGGQETWSPLFDKIGPNHEIVHEILDELYTIIGM